MRHVRVGFLACVLAACGSPQDVDPRPGQQRTPSVTSSPLVAISTIDLGPGEATAVNARGEVVGWRSTADFAQHAFLWAESSGLQDLGSVDGIYSRATALSSSSRVVGYAGSTVLMWTTDGGMTHLGSLAGDSVQPTAVNARGDVVGWTSFGQHGGGRAWVWTRADGMIDLCAGRALAVGESGEVVGGKEVSADPRPFPALRAFLWTSRSGMTDLGTLGGESSTAIAISPSGEVVGFSDGHAFLWTKRDGMEDLGVLDSGASGSGYSVASAVSSAGHVVGTSAKGDAGGLHAFLWTRRDGMIDLGTLGGARSEALAVNSRGEVVGSAETLEGETHAFFWSPATRMVDLGTLGPGGPGLPWSKAVGISPSGVIVGTVALHDQMHAVVWTVSRR